MRALDDRDISAAALSTNLSLAGADIWSLGTLRERLEDATLLPVLIGRFFAPTKKHHILWQLG